VTTGSGGADAGPRARGVTAAGLGLLLLAGGLTGLTETGGAGFPPAVPSTDGHRGFPAAAALPASPVGVDLNRADRTVLATLPGIGPILAERILAHREAHGPFRQPEELLAVPGIGAKRLAQVRPLVRVPERP
jgi:competence protein ComEA